MTEVSRFSAGSRIASGVMEIMQNGFCRQWLSSAFCGRWPDTSDSHRAARDEPFVPF
jgi:hypothetical protein